MTVREQEFGLRVPLDLNRSTGLHLSTVLRSLALDMRVLDPKYEDQGDLDSNVIMHLGLAWEEYLAATQHPDILFHPGELELDGIAMSPDGITVVDTEDLAESIGVDRDSWVLDEFKLTRKSARSFGAFLQMKDKKALLWLWQIMAYRHALNITAGRDCYTARLHCLFVNGNYDRSGPGGQPTYKIYILDFTQEELVTNWSMIRDYAGSMQENAA